MDLSKELEDMDTANVEFKAYSRKLLRRLMEVKNVVEDGQTEKAVFLLNELIEETKSDIDD